jgi:hypothetical protein
LTTGPSADDVSTSSDFGSCLEFQEDDLLPPEYSELISALSFCNSAPLRLTPRSSPSKSKQPQQQLPEQKSSSPIKEIIKTKSKNRRRKLSFGTCETANETECSSPSTTTTAESSSSSEDCGDTMGVVVVAASAAAMAVADSATTPPKQHQKQEQQQQKKKVLPTDHIQGMSRALSSSL